MIRRPPRSTRTDTLFPYTTLFRSMGAFVAASVLGTTPLHAGVTTPAKAPGYHEFEQSSDFYRKRKDRRHYSRDERIDRDTRIWRSEEHTSELQSLMRISYAVFCLKKKKKYTHIQLIKSHTNR